MAGCAPEGKAFIDKSLALNNRRKIKVAMGLMKLAGQSAVAHGQAQFYTLPCNSSSRLLLCEPRLYQSDCS